MTEEEIRLLQKKYCNDASIIKYGTYYLGEGVLVDEDSNVIPVGSVSADGSSSHNESDLATSVSLEDIWGGLKTEDLIQNNVDALVREKEEQEARAKAEEEAKIAEIMNKFSSNIQNNVSSLFDN